MKHTLFTSANSVLEAAFTKLRDQNPDDIVPGSTESRDQTIETDWFPIFRSGKYPQGNFSKADIEEVVDEWKVSGRRAPMVFDHLNSADLADDSKPGSAVGFLVELRSAEETDERYAGETLLEARFKVNWFACYATREGTYRNCSIGLAKFKCRDGKKRLGIHHLALLGAAVAGVDGLPEVIFSEMVTGEERVNLSFSEMDGAPSKEESMITFKDHQEALEKAEKAVRDELTARFTAEIDELKSGVTEAETKAAEATASAEAVKSELETTKAELETVKADSVVATESAKQEADKAGYERGLVEGERRFNAEKERSEIVGFCASLFVSGKVSEDESKTLPDTILALPAGAHRDQFRRLLDSRPGVPREGDSASKNFSSRPHGEEANSEPTDEDFVARGRELMAESPSKFSGIVDAVQFARREHTKKKEST